MCGCPSEGPDFEGIYQAKRPSILQFPELLWPGAIRKRVAGSFVLFSHLFRLRKDKPDRYTNVSPIACVTGRRRDNVSSDPSGAVWRGWSGSCCSLNELARGHDLLTIVNSLTVSNSARFLCHACAIGIMVNGKLPWKIIT